MKYDIVLVPDSVAVSKALIDLARKISIDNGLQPTYLLKDPEQLSIPHVSVIQFDVEEKPLNSEIFNDNKKDLLDSIWKLVTEVWQEVQNRYSNTKGLCNLPQKINYKNDTVGRFAGITWCEIIIDKKLNPLIQHFHEKLLQKLLPLGITPLNASEDRYNPHFTLFNIHSDLLQDTNLIKAIPESYQPILGSFSLKSALGIANQDWELVKKLKEITLKGFDQENSFSI